MDYINIRIHKTLFAFVSSIPAGPEFLTFKNQFTPAVPDLHVTRNNIVSDREKEIVGLIVVRCENIRNKKIKLTADSVYFNRIPCRASARRRNLEPIQSAVFNNLDWSNITVIP